MAELQKFWASKRPGAEGRVDTARNIRMAKGRIKQEVHVGHDQRH